MPREESWHKGLYKVRYVKLQANSSVITWVGWAWHVCSSRKEEAKQLGKGLEPGLGGAEESFKGLNNNCLRKAEVTDIRDISDIPVRPQKLFQERFSQGEKKKDHIPDNESHSTMWFMEGRVCPLLSTCAGGCTPWEAVTGAQGQPVPQ